jgi:hypothetical protein
MYDNCSGAVVCGLTNSFPNGMPSVPFVLLRVIKNHVPACPGAITGATTVCQGQNSVTYTVPQITNATSYEWTLPIGATGISTTNSITVNYGTSAVSGEITVKGNSIYGVGNSSSIAVTVNSVDLGVTVFNNVLTANQNGSSYQWLDCGNGNSPIVGETNQSYIPSNNGSYAVSVTINGCSNVSACNNINSIGVSTLESSTNLLSTFPNPNNGKFTLKAAKEFNISIVNELGETVKVVKLNSKNNYTEQIENLEAGIYFIVGTNDTDLIKKKIVVSK